MGLVADTESSSASGNSRPRIALFGASGTIGRATAAVLVRRGYEVAAFVRQRSGVHGSADLPRSLAPATIQVFDPADPATLAQAFAAGRFDAIISCMASRTGVPSDAWAVDHRAHINVLDAGRQAGVGHFILLSAICVQRPWLAFQHAKLAFEAALIASGMRYSIVRPTAYFKSLSGQIDRVRKGKPFLIFGEGNLTACKPISDRDLGNYIVECVENEARWNRILPIGGPGDAITPRQQGEALFALLRRPPKFRSVPVKMLDVIIGGLAAVGRFAPPLAAKAELARIGRYYATESMLVLDTQTGRYDAAATPSTGSETLVDYYRAVLAGEAAPERGDRAVF